MTAVGRFRRAAPGSVGLALEFLLLGALWGSSFLFMRLGLGEFGALPTVGVRVGIAALFLWPLVVLRGEAGVLLKNWKRLFLMGVFNAGIPFLCFAFALQSISTGLAAIVNATVPMFGAMVAWLWFHDRPGGLRTLGLVIGFAGVALLASGNVGAAPGASGTSPLWGVLACLVATMCYAISASATQRYLGGLPALATAAGSQTGATLALILPTAWAWPARMPGLQAWISLVFLGVMCSGFAYVLYFRLIERAGPSRTVTVTYLVPVFAIVYGALLLGESATGWMLLCGFIIVCGTALSSGMLKWPAKPMKET